jgi:hypothetical protein
VNLQDFHGCRQEDQVYRESQSGNTEFRLSRCNIAFENCEGLYSNHIAFQVVNNFAWTFLVGAPRIRCSELTLLRFIISFEKSGENIFSKENYLHMQCFAYSFFKKKTSPIQL